MMDAVNSQHIAEHVRHAMHYMDGPWILYMGVHAASDHGTSSYRVDGCCDNIRLHYARAMEAPGAREPRTSQRGPKQSER